MFHHVVASQTKLAHHCRVVARRSMSIRRQSASAVTGGTTPKKFTSTQNNGTATPMGLKIMYALSGVRSTSILKADSGILNCTFYSISRS